MWFFAYRARFFALFFLALTALLATTSGKDRDFVPVYSIAEGRFGRLEVVSSDGRALFRNANQQLTVWDIGGRRITAEATLRNWSEWGNKAPQQLRSQEIFRFQRDPNRLVAVQGPWVVLVDLKRKTEIRRVLISDAYLDPNVAVPDRSADLPGGVILASDPEKSWTAVAFNSGAETGLFLYDAHLELRAKWPLPRYVRDVSWSPDGRTLAVLYAARFNAGKRLVSSRLRDLSPEPDVWLFDTLASKPTRKFSTGSSEAQILFGSGGRYIYTISTYLYGTYVRSPGLIRVFDTRSCSLSKVITGTKSGVRGSMQLSPDGALLAADATTQRTSIFDTLANMETVYRISPRIVVVDLKSGQPLFEHHTSVDIYNGWTFDPSRFGFSSDSRLLLSDMWSGERRRSIDVYSVR